MLRRTVLSSLATFVAVTASGVFKRSRGQWTTYRPHQASVGGFLPSTSGFHFVNFFTNEPDIQLTIEGISFTAGNAADGLCGGFVFGAMDYFFAGQAIPATTVSPVPFMTLYNYLVKRQVDSFGPSANVTNPLSILPSNALKVVTYIGLSNDEMAAAIANVEFPAIKSDIDNGQLSPLYLIGGSAHPLDPLGVVQTFSDCHQVLVYAYNIAKNQAITLSVYDPNEPNNDSVTISFQPDSVQNLVAPQITANVAGNHVFRGLFRCVYSPAAPDPNYMPGEQGFGDISKSIFFAGKFQSGGTSSISYYNPPDSNWWLGVFVANLMNWTIAGNTAVRAGNTWQFGNLSAPPPAHRFWVGAFDGTGLDNILFFNQKDENWWLGTFAGGQLGWKLATNTAGFGGAEAAGIYFVGKFVSPTVDSIMFYFGQDGDWLLGTFSGTSLSFNRACNTAVKAGNTWQFGNLSAPPLAHRFWVGAFDATGLDNILFYSPPPDSNWWLGTFNGNQLSWNFVGNTAGFGNISELQFWIGDFGTFGRDNVLFYYPGDGNWWLGTLNRSESASQLNWARTSNTGTSLTSYNLTIIP